MKLLISAAEASADLHAARLVDALRSRVSRLDLIGIGGSHLEREGLQPLAKASDLAVMGSLEVLSRLPVIRRAGKDLLREAEKFRPDVAVLVDYPGFHFRLAPRLHAMGIPVVYFIPPKVWVWRKSRLRTMKPWVSKVLCILPFEPPLYQAAGIDADYVGSPLVDELPIHLTRSEARARLAFSEQERVMALLPGSRPSEMKRHWTAFLDAALLFARRRREHWTVAIPIASTLPFSFWREQAERWLERRQAEEFLKVQVLQESSGEILRAADMALIKSGTSTLEAGVLECPMVIAYRPGRVTSFAVRNILRYRGPVGLVNLFSGWRNGGALIAPEVLHEEMTAERLAFELESVFGSEDRLGRMRRELAQLREQMLSMEGTHGGPSARAADAVLAVATKAAAAGRMPAAGRLE